MSCRFFSRPLLTLFILQSLYLGCANTPPKLDFVAPAIAPLEPKNFVTRIEFASCADQKKPQPIWQAMLNDTPDLYLGVGDNIYSSTKEDRPMSLAYSQQAAIPEFQRFRAKVPMLATWDDNDYGVNDGGSENPDKYESRREFFKFFPVDAALVPPEQEGIYHSVILGPPEKSVQIILLDTRTFRSPLEKNLHPRHKLDIYQPTSDKSKTILGQAQWDWLTKELDKPARFRILVSSIQVIHDFHSFEKWGNFPHEKARLFDLLTNKKIRNLLIVSGDRHQGEIHQQTIPPLRRLLDVTASGINRVSTSTEEEPAPTRIGQIYRQANYGLIELNWPAGKVRVSIKDTNGKTVQSVDVEIK